MSSIVSYRIVSQTVTVVYCVLLSITFLCCIDLLLFVLNFKDYRVSVLCAIDGLVPLFDAAALLYCQLFVQTWTDDSY